jgi:hypothetical protein
LAIEFPSASKGIAVLCTGNGSNILGKTSDEEVVLVLVSDSKFVDVSVLVSIVFGCSGEGGELSSCDDKNNDDD